MTILSATNPNLGRASLNIKTPVLPNSCNFYFKKDYLQWPERSRMPQTSEQTRPRKVVTNIRRIFFKNSFWSSLGKVLV